MASSYHHQHHHTHHQQINHCNSTSCNSNSCNCTSCNSKSNSCCNPPIPVSQNPSDQLLQALATSLLLQSQQQPLFQSPIPAPSIPQFQSSIPHPTIPHSSIPFSYSNEHHYSNPHQYGFQFQHKTHNPNPIPIPNPKSIDPLVSLFDRVAALELSLFSNPNPNPNPSIPAQRSNRSSNPAPNSKKYSPNRSDSLKDFAARIIQLHFRKFLVRRSQILRDLKRLTVMKCHVASLKSTVSHRAEIDPKMASDRAADLLLQLDCIRSGDPMIHEGKRSIERELIRIVDFVDKIYLREREISHNERNSNREEEEEDDDDDESFRDERKIKKKVSFGEKCRKSRVFDKEHGDCFDLPNGVFDEMNFEEIEGGFGKKCGRKNGGLAPPVPAQMEMRWSDERREK